MTTEAANDTPQVPFNEDSFKGLIGIDSDDQGGIRMRVGYAGASMVAGGNAPDMSDPAVFMLYWLSTNWDQLRSIAAGEYNVRQSLAMVTQGDEGLKLVMPDGSQLQ